MIPLGVVTAVCSMLSAQSHDVNAQTVSVHLSVRMYNARQHREDFKLICSLGEGGVVYS